MLFVPLEHARLPINDDENVGRALALKPLSGETTQLTYVIDPVFRRVVEAPRRAPGHCGNTSGQQPES